MECFILAGGQSRRFGEDKLLFRIGNLRTIEHVIRSAREVFSKVYIVAKDREKFRGLGVEVIGDLLPDQAPVVGLYTALRKSYGDSIVVLSGDMPLIKPQVLRLLIREYRKPVTIFSSNGKLHPLVGAYSRTLISTVEVYIKEGRKSLIGLLGQINYKVIDEDEIRRVDPDLSSLLNMNTKEDLEIILGRIV